MIVVFVVLLLEVVNQWQVYLHPENNYTFADCFLQVISQEGVLNLSSNYIEWLDLMMGPSGEIEPVTVTASRANVWSKWAINTS